MFLHLYINSNCVSPYIFFFPFDVSPSIYGHPSGFPHIRLFTQSFYNFFFFLFFFAWNVSIFLNVLKKNTSFQTVQNYSKLFFTSLFCIVKETIIFIMDFLEIATLPSAYTIVHPRISWKCQANRGVCLNTLRFELLHANRLR